MKTTHETEHAPTEIVPPWKRADVLEELHVERGWPARDIARRFDVETRKVARELERREIYTETARPPMRGIAGKVWRESLQNAEIRALADSGHGRDR
ncbi:hypothetical protein [Haloferax sulfurifontis]|uniref:Uncharacterized protein n=1 Tax=Haloferax sulfurifontis ATCC BAA-897 TaxID=662480 RepID=M0I780_9EURY|nr:hypothetical protein [Haloferax sulfurifontis]ELZ92646.1 hypothetical protein C441_10518 [Haloferax sulfurifontis ATCC BAA-897]